MRVFVTGHTSGLGRAVYNLLVEKGYDVEGGSRSNGLNINDASTWEYIVNGDYDILINNCYSNNNQIKLLDYVYKRWSNRNKRIINIGSAGMDLPNRPHDQLNYKINKRSLNEYSNWIAENDRKCLSMMYNVGKMNTPLYKDAFDKSNEDFHDIQTNAYTVLFMIEHPYGVKEIKDRIHVRSEN